MAHLTRPPSQVCYCNSALHEPLDVGMLLRQAGRALDEPEPVVSRVLRLDGRAPLAGNAGRALGAPQLQLVTLSWCFSEQNYGAIASPFHSRT